MSPYHQQAKLYMNLKVGNINIENSTCEKLGVKVDKNSTSMSTWME